MLVKKVDPEEKYEFKLTKKEQNMSRELFKQVEKRLSFATKGQSKAGIARYRASMRAFCDFVAKEFKMRNLNNISNKHLAAFVEHRKKLGISNIHTEVSAIRKFHSTLEKPRYKELEKDNSKLGLDKRKVVENGKNVVDRAWTEREFKEAVRVAEGYGHKDIAIAFKIARYGGLRINEVTALTKSQIKEGLKYGHFTVTHAKGGILRTSYVDSKEYREALQEALKYAKSERVFQTHGLSHKQAKDRIQNFIYNHRHKWSEVAQHNLLNVDNPEFRVRENLTFHGLRHSYAREKYRENLAKGMSEKEARKDVAMRLGHGRDQVTKIYL